MKRSIICICLVLVFLFSACEKKVAITTETIPTIETIKETTKEIIKDTTVIETTEEITIESTEENIEETTVELLEEIIETQSSVEDVKLATESDIESTENETKADLEYDNTATEKYRSEAVPLREKNVVEINAWEYGKTPLEWIYVKPNTQIICNNTPNNSVNFSYKKQASSGSKGCFMPIFIKSNSVGDDYDGRLYSIYDYTKREPKEMLWSDTATFESLVYRDYQVKELLEKKYDVERVTRNIMKVKDTYVNIVYVTELDEIIDKYYK